MINKPLVLMIGGPDVDTRIDLMRLLGTQYQIQMAGSKPELAGLFEQEGFKYHYYPLGQRVNPFSYFVSFIALFRIIRKEQPNIVHTFDTKPSILGRLAAKLNRVPVVIATITGLGSLYIIHGKLLPQIIQPIYELLQKILSGISDLTIFYTRDDLAFFLSRKLVKREKTLLIPGSGILLDRFSPDRFSSDEIIKVMEELGAPAGQTVITMIARLVRSKGVLLFADLARKIQSQMPGTWFLLIGPHDLDSLDSLSSIELNIVSEAVHWIGQQSQVEKYLAASHIFILPSEREGIPRVLIEAAAMNLPLIASDLPGCREVIVHGSNGYLVPFNDFHALEQAVIDLITHSEKRIQFGIESRKLVLKNFDLRNISEILIKIYRKLLLEKGISA
jgi:glycosyltransferase involved in cell wall biosynthesis